MFLGWPFSKIVREILIRQKFKNCGSGEWGLLALYRNEGILWKSSPLKPLVGLWNNFTDMFLGWPFSKIVALVNGGFLHYTEMKEFFKNLLLWNRWSDCEIISQICSLGDPFQKLLVKFWSVKKCGSGEWGLLALYRNEGILKKSSSLKPMVRFWNNFTELLLGWPFLKIVRKILIDEETWLWWMRATCTIGKWRNS